jgi:LPXTG-motif cell wall-anchored protein
VGVSAAYASDERAGGAPQGSYQPNRAADGSRVGSSCTFSLDGHTWHEAGQVRDSALTVGSDKKVRIDVRAGDGKSCTVSLASYSTHGSTWQTSGEQELVDYDTVSLGQGTTGSLRIAVPSQDCFAQIDLYRGSVKHDGTTAPLPEGPDHPVFNGVLIAAWHGGTRVCTNTPTPTPSAGAPTTAPATATASPTPSATTAVPAPSTSSASAPAPSSSSSPAAELTPTASIAGHLAETGADDHTLLLAAGAAVLVAGGGITFAASRRRHAVREH